MSEKAVIGIVKSEVQAERVLADLRAASFSPNDISVLFPDKTGTRDFAHEKGTKMPEGAATGAATGGVLGGTVGWLVGIGALAIPGLGPFVAAGPIMAALAGAAAGASAGGVTGALVGLGFPEYEAKQYEAKLREGNLLISVHTEDMEERSKVKEIFDRHHAEGVGTQGEEKVRSTGSR